MSARNRRFLRTLLLGVAAMGVLVWVVTDQFDIDPRDMLRLFLGVLVASGLLMLAAAATALLWTLLRRVRRRRGEGR